MYILSISSVDKRWIVSPILLFLSNVAMNIGMQRSIWVAVFNYFCIYLEVRALGHMVVPFLAFWRTVKLLHFTVPWQCKRVPISPYSHKHVIFSFSWMWVWKGISLFFFKFIFCWVSLIYNVSIYAVHQSESYIYIYPFSSRLHSCIGHYRALTRSSCAI